MPIISGVAMDTSKSVQPSSIFLIRSSLPTASAPASSAIDTSSPCTKTCDPHRPAYAVGQVYDTPDHLVRVPRIRSCAQMQLDRLVEFCRGCLLGKRYGLLGLVALSRLDERFGRFGTAFLV